MIHHGGGLNLNLHLSQSKIRYASASYYEVEHAEVFANAYHAANPFDVYDDFRDKACKTLKHLVFG
jgi:hypothetical protein